MTLFSGREAITHEPESVLRLILDIKILTTDIFQQFYIPVSILMA